MNCCQCQGIEALFDDKTARKELKDYRRKGPSKTTRLLIEALEAEEVEGMTLLDIGGGIGAIQHELLKANAAGATHVDASSAYLAASRAEADRQGHTDRVDYRHGNFVDLASDIEPADIVTLDRVICCYHDMEALVGLSSALATKFYGVVYPRDTWWIKAGSALANLGLWLIRNPFRTFVHPTEAIEAIVRRHGFQRRFYRRTFLWQVVVYGRG